MANTAYMTSIEAAGANWTPLSAEPLVLSSVTITASPDNAQVVNFRVNGGDPAPWAPGVSVELRSIDLSTIEIAGMTGNKVLIVGYAGV